MEKRLTMFLASLFLSIGMAFSQTIISGTVVSADDGEPIIGATIRLVGTNLGAVTDANGKFSFTQRQGVKQITVSYVGYETQTLSIKQGMFVELKPDQKQLDEVIVVAYGTTKKSSFTGSAAAIDAEKITSRPVTNVTKALDGQVTGVLTTSGSGQPGSGSSVIIRGFGSINASNNPLYVVDGVPYGGSISAINPQDIESMTVLKDASAAALYGSRAANGVVIITTKKGKEGRPQVSLHNTVGWSWRAVPMYDTVDKSEFIQLSYEALRNGYQFKNAMSYADASAAAISALGSTLAGARNPEQYNPFKSHTWGTLIDPVTGQIQPGLTPAWDDTWFDEIYDRGAMRHEHTMTLNGGTDRTDYLLSLGYINEDGILLNTGFQRYSARVNVNSQVTDWFSAGLNANLAHNKSNFNQYTNTSTANPWYTSQFMGPIYPVYLKDANGQNALDANGNIQLDYGETGRPVANDFNALGDLTLDRSYTSTDNASIRTNVIFGSDKESFGWAQGLKLNINFGVDYQSAFETDMMNKFHGNQKNAGGLIEKYADRYQTYTFGQQLMWNRKFGEHTFGVLGGHEFYEYKHSYLTATKTNIVDGIDELRPASTISAADSYSNEHSIESWLGRINYSFADKYYFDASVRTDGSSRFHKDNRWGTFWSVGANWRITSEKFMKDIKWIDNLSFKISYGENGNENLDTYYAWQNLYDLEFANGNRIGGFVSTLENKDISWEKNGMLNIGLEGALLDSRIRFSVEYFNKKTKDMLLNYPMALSTGFDGYYANVGNMRNTGWEFMLSGMLVKTKDVQWTLSWMGTAQKNKVLKLTEESNQILNGVRIIKEGYDVNTFYMAKSAGVDPASGAQLYYAYDHMDDDGNLYIPEYDDDGNEIGRTPGGEYITSDYTKAVNSKYFVGKRTPDLYGSISTELNLFKCIDFSVMTTYSIGGKIYDSLYYSSMFNQYAGNTWNKNVLRRWQKPGDITDIPRVELNAARTVTSNYLVDASYFAIKNITLGYTLPSRLARKIALNRVRVYTSFDNVALFTHLKGMDPQYNMTGGTNYTYTPNKNLTVGLDINF